LSRWGPVGVRREGARELERAVDAANSGARIQRIRASRLPAAGDDLGGAPVPVAQLGGLSKTQHKLPAHPAHAHSHRRAASASAARIAWIPAYRHGAS